MGVYIPNIEMPKSCDDCPHPTCTLWQSVNGGERNEKCPIVPVPPHGRLIDEKVVLDHFVGLSNNEWNQKVCTSWADAFAEAASDICDIPTVIEAEE